MVTTNMISYYSKATNNQIFYFHLNITVMTKRKIDF
jgi:hypothetical protein